VRSRPKDTALGSCHAKVINDNRGVNHGDLSDPLLVAGNLPNFIVQFSQIQSLERLQIFRQNEQNLQNEESS
jgi:hypothetical protein